MGPGRVHAGAGEARRRHLPLRDLRRRDDPLRSRRCSSGRLGLSSRGGGLMDETARTADQEAELRELRARAYGPDADILDDPPALARLAELESAHLAERMMEEPVPGRPETAMAAPGAGPAAVLVAEG